MFFAATISWPELWKMQLQMQHLFNAHSGGSFCHRRKTEYFLRKIYDGNLEMFSVQ